MLHSQEVTRCVERVNM